MVEHLLSIYEAHGSILSTMQEIIKTLGWRDGSVGECLLGKHEDLSFVMVMQDCNPRASGMDRQRETGPGGLMYLESMTELWGRACLTDTQIGL